MNLCKIGAVGGELFAYEVMSILALLHISTYACQVAINDSSTHLSVF